MENGLKWKIKKSQESFFSLFLFIPSIVNWNYSVHKQTRIFYIFHINKNCLWQHMEKKLGPCFSVFLFCFRSKFFESYLKSTHGLKRSPVATWQFCGKIIIKNDWTCTRWWKFNLENLMGLNLQGGYFLG